MKASVHVLASMFRSGRASTHLDDLSVAVNRYSWPSEEAGEGPTRSTCTWENLRAKWRGVELLAACGHFHVRTAGSLGTWLPLFANNLSEQCSRSRSESGSGSTCFWTSRIRIHWSEVWIRIRIHRIHMFLGLPDPDSSIILLSSSINSKKTLDSYCFVTSFGLFIFVK